MERNNLKNNHIISGRSKNNKVRDSWEYCTSYDNHHSGDLLSGYLWNPRSYTCSFCKREFRSAQALGGHMNVHRRDRARLRQYSPPNLNLNPNPNSLINLNISPNPIPNNIQNTLTSVSSQASSIATNYYQVTTTLPPTEAKNWLIESSPCPYEERQDSRKIKYSNSLSGLGRTEGFGAENECGVLKNAQVVRLDLEIGLITGGKEIMDLDLELRLGR